MIGIIDSTPDPEMIKKCSCRNCAARLEYTQNSVQRDYSTDYTGGKDYYNYIQCPSCSAQVYVT